MDKRLAELREKAEKDLTQNLLPWWAEHAPDRARGGFYGKIDENGVPVRGATRSVILNARLLWTFSATCRVLGTGEYREMARRAYGCLTDRFLDPEYGGYYTDTDESGAASDAHKMVYGNAFALYALCEYAVAFDSGEAARRALELAQALENAWDPACEGYYETAARDWSPTPDVLGVNRSARDVKTMNTHLHLLEAFTALLRACPRDRVRGRVRALLSVMADRVTDRDTHHFHCFMGRDWQPNSRAISYGHDIESSWLMAEAASALGDGEAACRVRAACADMARAVLEEGLTPEGALLSEYDPSSGAKTQRLSWWEQCEAVVGFLNAWQMTGDDRFLDASVRCCRFIDSHFIDKERGGWHPYVGADGAGYGEKLSKWVCPYHNARMSLEIISRCRALGG